MAYLGHIFPRLPTPFINSNGVVIRTNGGTLTVGSSAAVAKGQIWHYGTLDNAFVYTEDTCFHTHGKIAQMNLEKGKAIAEDKGYVALVQAAENTLVEEKDTGVFYIPSNATTATVNAVVAATLGYTVTEDGTTADEIRNTKLASTVYEINNKFDLIAFRDAVNAGYDFSNINVVMTNDIDMSGIEWTPIGNTSGHAFTGTFDGKGYTISNLTSTHYTGEEIVTSSSGDRGSPLGLFGFGFKNVTIKNLNIDVRFNEYDSYIGGVMGLYYNENNDSEETYNVLFDTINVTGIIAGKGKIGGVIGSTYNTDIQGDSKNKTITITFNKCTNDAKISGDRIGGIAGTIDGKFKNDEANSTFVKISFVGCINNQAEILSTGSTFKSGGIAGFLCGGGNYSFTNCSSVAIENGGKLFGRIHDSGAYGWENQERCEAHSLNYIYGMWNTYKQTTAYVSVLINGGGATYLKYTSGHALESDEWRLTINGKQYKCGYNTLINSASDCTEMTGDHLSNPTAAEFSDFFVDDTYEVGSVDGNNVYLVPKE